MKNKKELSEKIMNKIITFEKKRTFSWIFKFASGVLVLGLVFLGLAIFIVDDLIGSDAFSILAIFGEDREIIQEFWIDSIRVFWEELPKVQVGIAALILVAIICLIIVKRKKIGVITKRLKGLAKYKKRH